ncbi:MAG: response regulator transcription factor [Deltaproteobacteria bacterium]|nr:MAG: response regulator transcription factor [Deltaproteobacteria bacterium]
MSRTRVLLADDHTLLLEAFTKLLEPACEVVGAVGDGRALLEHARELEPDVIVLDISMPRLNGLEAGRALKKLLPRVKLIFLTVNEDPDVAAEALAIGASGYLLKRSAASELFRAIQQVADGNSYVTPLVADSAGDPRRRKALGRLTSRQREVLQLLAEGHSMKEAAALLNVTPRTVAFHKYRLMGELGLKTNAELVQFAIKQGIVTQ